MTNLLKTRFIGLFAALLLLSACGSDDSTGAVATDAATDGMTADANGSNADGEEADDTSTEEDAAATGEDSSAADDASAQADSQTSAEDGSAGQADTSDDTATGCTKTDPPDEVCDGIDNDCDGFTDDAGDGEMSAKKSVCDDDNVCNGSEKCVQGKCKGGALKVCAGGSTCAKSSCDSKKGCIQTPIDGKCDDGNPCTTGDFCANAKCTAGTTAKTCDDGNACTKDVCDPKKGCTTSGSVCDDGNPCTIDSCDAKTGKCTAKTKLGCTPCTTASQCDDKNACTTDSCHAGVCLQKAISGCAGPTDYVLKKWSVSVTKPFGGIPGALIFDVTVENKGKTYAGKSSGMLKWLFRGGSQSTYNPKDPVLAYSTWSGSNIGVPASGTGKTIETVQLAYNIKNLTVPAVTAKFVCLHLYDGGDKNLANNTICLPNPLPYPKYTLASFSAKPQSGTSYGPGSDASVILQVKNTGGGEVATELALYASVDNKWDKSDAELGTASLGKLATNGTLINKSLPIKLSKPAMQTTHKYLCAVVGKKFLDKDPNQTDNARCVAATFTNLADLTASPVTLWTSDAKGNAKNFPQWGDKFGCRLDLSNIGTGDAKPTKVRCFLAPASQTVPQPVKDGWDVHWDTPAIKNQDKFTGAHSKATMAITTPTSYGNMKLCAFINWPKNQPEKSFSNNTVCRAYTVVSMDLFPRPGAALIYTTNYKNPPLKAMKIGVTYKVQFQMGNKGNIGTTDKALISKMASRVVLSKDSKFDSSDITIFESKGGYSKLGAHGKTSPWYGFVTWSGFNTIKIPAGTAKGTYHVLFVTDATNVFKEPKDNNALLYGVVTVD
ncbi:MAG: hypothetical protein KC502_22790 [Myxococcales bacterium]|nr:hypothetical protein [Myxococcales bacterium]